MNFSNGLKIYLLIIAVVFITISGTAHAMRCGGSLILAGDAQYLVQQECGVPDSTHHVGTGPQGEGDQEYWYYKQGNVTEELNFIDGHLYEINDIYQ